AGCGGMDGAGAAVRGRAGDAAAALLAERAARKASVQADTAAARKLADEAKEAALGRILNIAADSGEEIDMLAALPLAPPANLRAEVTPDAVALRWEPSTSAGQVSYKVTRVITAPGGGQPERRVIGTTNSTEF